MSPLLTTPLTRKSIAVILGGGRGTRLHPLTKYRAKPAVPVGGKYRLIDIPISNCLNSGLTRMYVLTQFLSSSLNRHVNLTYQLDPFSKGFVTLEVAAQTEESQDWFQGTSDAVRRTLRTITQSDPQYVVILPGDTIFRMDLAEMLEFHVAKNADITIALHATRREEASAFGIIELDGDDTIRKMTEKPPQDKLTGLEASPRMIEKWKMPEDRPFLASMGVYIFRTAMLEQMLADPAMIDFGHHILPHCVLHNKVCGFVFSNFWEDIGTIRAYFDTALELSRPHPPFRFYNSDSPIYTRMRYLPASRLGDSHLCDTLVAEGCRIEAARLENCQVGLRSSIGRGVTMRRTVMMGADYYEDSGEVNRYEPVPTGSPPVGIGDGCEIENAIIDKNARVGAGCRIRNAGGHENFDDPEGRYYVKDGIVIVPKHAILPPGLEI